MKRKQTARIMLSSSPSKTPVQRRPEVFKKSRRPEVRAFEAQNPLTSPVFEAYRRVGDVNMEKGLVAFAARHTLGAGKPPEFTGKVLGEWFHELGKLMRGYRGAADFLARLLDVDLRITANSLTAMGVPYKSRTAAIWDTPVVPRRLIPPPQARLVGDQHHGRCCSLSRPWS